AFSFNFGTVLTTNYFVAGTSSGIATSGTNRVGTNISVVWDTYDNGSANINRGIRAVRNEGGTNQIVLSNSPVLPHVPNSYGLLHFRRADIVWENNQLSVSYNGQVVFTNLPTGSFTPVAGDIFTFAGITGSQDMHASIDNLRVQTSTNSTLPLPAASGSAPTLSYGGNRNLQLQQAVNLQPVYGGGAFTPSTPFAVTRLAGSGSTTENIDAQGTNAVFFQPAGLAVDRWGYVYVADWARHSVRKISPEGMVWTLAGSGSAGGNNSTTGPRDVTFNRPTGVAVDTNGNVYVSERDGFRIRKLTPAGASTTLAGTGSAASADGTGTAAGFDYPEGICIDPSGQYLYVADSANDEQGARGSLSAWGVHSIRRITLSNAVVTRLAGDDFGYTNAIGTNARFATPVGVACDGANLYVAELTGNRIRKLALSNNSVTTLAGATNAAIGTAGSTDG
ncbi:MAG: hypothetical protein EBT68_08260, partial [Verrucomicrobia bacterium]|nr:hypothetical protein [Verrucomicrobiota bacterium]